MSSPDGPEKTANHIRLADSAHFNLMLSIKKCLEIEASSTKTFSAKLQGDMPEVCKNKRSHDATKIKNQDQMMSRVFLAEVNWSLVTLVCIAILGTPGPPG